MELEEQFWILLWSDTVLNIHLRKIIFIRNYRLLCVLRGGLTSPLAKFCQPANWPAGKMPGACRPVCLCPGSLCGGCSYPLFVLQISVISPLVFFCCITAALSLSSLLKSSKAQKSLWALTLPVRQGHPQSWVAQKCHTRKKWIPYKWGNLTLTPVCYI